jgi:hypothetical protein
VLWADPGWANAQILQVNGKDVATIGREVYKIIRFAPEPLHFLMRKRGGVVATIEVYTTYQESASRLPVPSEAKGPVRP